MSEVARYADRMTQRVRSLQRGAFASLLRGGVYSEEEALAILPYLQISYDHSGYCVAVIRASRIPDASMSRTDDFEPPADDAERVLRVHIGRHGYVFRRKDDELVVLWCVARSGDELRRRILAAASELESRSATTLAYGIGAARTELVSVDLSLREAERRLVEGVLGTSAPSADPDAPSAHDADRISRFAARVTCEREPARSAQIYVLEHFREPGLTLETVARHLNLTDAYLSQVFREQTGHTYSSFLEQVRVEAARELLTESALSIAATAQRAGYQTKSTFFRAFRRVLGESPSGYRKRVRSIASLEPITPSVPGSAQPSFRDRAQRRHP